MAGLTADNTFNLEIDGLSSQLAVARVEGVEGISQLFQFDLVLTSDDRLLSFSDIIGKSATLTIETQTHQPRHVNGIISRFRQAEDGRRFVVYHATIVPKLWRLQHRQDSRIFQGMTAPAIIEQVLTAAGISDLRLSLSGSFATREYCVQYRETDFAFVSRLMEEEGIFYFFEHVAGVHTLVLADAPAAASPIAGNPTLEYRPATGALTHTSEAVQTFTYTEELRPGKVSLSDFNFKNPNLSLLTSTSGQAETDYEIYDYPGEYDNPGDGTSLSKVRLEELHALKMVGDGSSTCMRLTTGYTFTLSDHIRDDYNVEYLVTRIHHKGSQAGRLGEAGTREGYQNTFQCIPASVPFRPARVTPRPTIKGIQTAIVTGPGGEEIHTDEHGRVKVHFHWDRKGSTDDKSSCWIRVSQLWAGGGWGAMWIPRIGHEVVVDFIEGDPDRPLIVGRVYHGANVPPYALPAEKTKSTIKSNSSQGGGGSNELRFEDKAGSEEIYIHGQKDWNIVIKNDKTQKIGRDQSLDVGRDDSITVHRDRNKRVDNDQSESIGANKTITVGNNHGESIGGNESITVKKDAALSVRGSRSVKVGKIHTENVKLAQVSSVGGAWSKSVGAAMALSVGASKTESVKGKSTETVGGNKSVAVAKGYSIDVGKDSTSTVKDNAVHKVGKNRTENVGKDLTIVVGDKIKVECGKAIITVDKNGNVMLEGKDIIVKGSGNVKVKGKKIKVESDGTVDVTGGGKVKVKGSQIGLN